MTYAVGVQVCGVGGAFGPDVDIAAGLRGCRRRWLTARERDVSPGMSVRLPPALALPEALPFAADVRHPLSAASMRYRCGYP
ncbi:hypothetical protein J4732_18755 [Serratia marcescens]|uniref:Uncharacterized protein n=1 Tax=Serratia marcescens TaxID=615 RepID=A0A939NKL1_SERMA|nr:hypothetical protein [Serratia marcescens]